MPDTNTPEIQVIDNTTQPADVRPREVIEVITTLDPLTIAPAPVDLQPAVVVQTEPAQPAPVATSPVDPAPGAVDVTPAVSAPAEQAPADSTPAAAPAVAPLVPADSPAVTPADQPAPVQPAPAADPAPAAEVVPPIVPSPAPPAEPVQVVPEPTVGRIVHFFLDNGEARPAMVVSVQDGIYTDLQVFTNGEADKSLIPERVIMLNVNNGVEHPQVPGLVHRAQVLMGTEPGQWSWPARS